MEISINHRYGRFLCIISFALAVGAGCARRLPAPESGGADLIDKAEFIKLANPRPASGDTGTGVLKADLLYSGDVVGITIYDKLPVNMEKREEVKRIDDNGKIFVLPAGEIVVAGLTLSQAERAVEEKMAPIVVSPHVEITIVKRIYEPRIYLFGEVANSGVVPLKPGDRLLDAISSAGGCRSDAYRRSIKVLRPQGAQVAMLSINLSDILQNGRLDENITLQDQDVIFVPRRLFTNFSEVMAVLGNMLPWYYFANNFIK